VHALSTVEYYLGARCASPAAQVGVDDEKGANGTVAFEVWADGRRVAATGVLTNADPAQTLSADVTGADTVQLVVTDSGDGVDSDHADWADAQLRHGLSPSSPPAPPLAKRRQAGLIVSSRDYRDYAIAAALSAG
jgi:hypothetical protein